MSNTVKLGSPVIPAGDFGLGLCLQCLGEVMVKGDKAPQPKFGISLAPMAWPPNNPMGLVAVPCCWDHLAMQAKAAQSRPLLVTAGKL